MHFRRVMIEQLSQVATIAAGLIDRIVLTAVLLRVWGVSSFETWSIVLAVAGLVSMSEFGFSLYFNNRLMEETEQNRIEDARRTFFIANTIFATVALLGFLGVAVLTLDFPVTGIEGNPGARAAMLVLAAGVALRISTSASQSLYRANRQYARLVLVLALGETLRVAAALLACLLGGGLLVAAIASTVASVIPQAAFPVIDARRRFLPHQIGFALPSQSELKAAMTISTAFFAQSVPAILLASLPVMVLGKAGLGVGILASFVLVRTLSGLPRTLLQQFGIVLGQECGRRLAVDDQKGALMLVAESARLYAVLSGLTTGFLIATGRQIVVLWTGNEQHFRIDYLVCATLPMVFAAISVLASNVLIATNAPLPAAIGRWAQLALTAVVAVLFPSQDLALGMLVALAVGEIVGFAPVAYAGVARLVRGAGFSFHMKEILISLVAVVVGTCTSSAVVALIAPMTSAARIAALTLALLANALVALAFGLRRRSRDAMLHQVIHPQIARIESLLRAMRSPS